ncbi:uncharacterized protein [Centruroides vittatus]|uniref:uncharacterized protein n=1 Tax=Centruroides vittatus TaxID=120091 RepID=UPI00350EDAB4
MGKTTQKSTESESNGIINKQFHKTKHKQLIKKTISRETSAIYKSKLRRETIKRRNTAFVRNCKQLISEEKLQERSKNEKELYDANSKKQANLKNPKSLKFLSQMYKNENLQKSAINLRNSVLPKKQKQSTSQKSLREISHKISGNEYTFDQDKFLKVKLNKLKLDTQTKKAISQYINLPKNDNFKNNNNSTMLKDVQVVCKKLDLHMCKNYVLNCETKPVHQNLFVLCEKIDPSNYLRSKNKSKDEDLLVECKKSLKKKYASDVKTELKGLQLSVVCEKLNPKNYTLSSIIESKNTTDIEQDTTVKGLDKNETNGVLLLNEDSCNSVNLLNDFNIESNATDTKISKETISSGKKPYKNEIFNFDLPHSSEVSLNYNSSELNTTELLDYKRNAEKKSISIEDIDDKCLQSPSWLVDYKSDKLLTPDDETSYEDNLEATSSDKGAWCVVS